MPNWCNNKATFIPVTDEAKELLKQFKEYLDSAPEEPKFFGWFYPAPEDQAENWYRWNIDNWGTKWDVSVSKDNVYPEEGVIDFYEDTAWSPPIEFYNFMTEKGFSVEASYYEPGAGFVGTYSDGVDDCEDIPSGDKAFNLLRNLTYDSVDVYLENDLDFSSLKNGDVIGTNREGNSIIYLSHEFVPWSELRKNNLGIFNSDARDWDSELDEVCNTDKDFYLLEIIEDNSKCGSTSAIVYSNRLNTISYYPD